MVWENTLNILDLYISYIESLVNWKTLKWIKNIVCCWKFKRLFSYYSALVKIITIFIWLPFSLSIFALSILKFNQRKNMNDFVHVLEPFQICFHQLEKMPIIMEVCLHAITQKTPITYINIYRQIYIEFSNSKLFSLYIHIS